MTSCISCLWLVFNSDVLFPGKLDVHPTDFLMAVNVVVGGSDVNRTGPGLILVRCLSSPWIKRGVAFSFKNIDYLARHLWLGASWSHGQKSLECLEQVKSFCSS